MNPGKSTNAKRQRARTLARKALAQGSPSYMDAVRSTGCVVSRLATKPGTPCDGRMTFSHLEKTNRPEHSWRRAVGMCFHHHLDEFEGNVERFCDTYGLPFLVLVGEANRNAELFGHLVDA